VNLAGSLCLAVSTLLGLGLPFVLGSLFVMVSAIGLILPTSTALALSNYPERAGTASALLGLLQYLVGGLAAPLVGLAGEDTAVPLGLVTVSASAGGCLVFAVLVVPPILERRRTAVLSRSAEPPLTPG
jgi:DHA1 family bicyclomycin/chloramphenicol resistance-like MFS transporter